MNEIININRQTKPISFSLNVNTLSTSKIGGCFKVLIKINITKPQIIQFIDKKLRGIKNKKNILDII